ncbi:MAG: DUF11 domain-containing protein [Clostridium sp.]
MLGGVESRGRRCKGADLMVIKCGKIRRNGCITIVDYTIKIGNYGPCEAKDVVLYDCLPCNIKNARFSVDGGNNWEKWCGKWRLGNLPSYKHYIVLIGGVVTGSSCELVNTAWVESSTPDPNLENNQSTLVLSLIRKKLN